MGRSLNIAESQARIAELGLKRQKIYTDMLAHIDAEVAKLQENIKAKCVHHEDMLLVEILGYDDEYGKTLESCEKHHITCSICKKDIYILTSFLHRNPGVTLQEVMGMTPEYTKSLR